MNRKSSSDEALIEALRLKNLDALEELYDRHHRTALALAYRVLADRNLAEDAIQEAFLAVWRQPESFKPDRGSARSWLLSIVRHRAIDITRGRSFVNERLSLDEMNLQPEYPDVWHQVVRRSDEREVRQAVKGLPAEQREVIILAYFGGRTQREMSESLGLPLGTVKGRIRLGMQKLRGLLGGFDDGET